MFSKEQVTQVWKISATGLPLYCLLMFQSASLDNPDLVLGFGQESETNAKSRFILLHMRS